MSAKTPCVPCMRVRHFLVLIATRLGMAPQSLDLKYRKLASQAARRDDVSAQKLIDERLNGAE